MAAELARLPVDVLVSVGGEPSAVAARAATSKIPTVSTIGTDPVRLGLAASDNRPGGNTTGVNIQTGLAEAKRIGLLRELVPQAATIGVLLNPSNQQLPEQTKDIEQASQAMKLPVRVLRAATEGEINTAFEPLRSDGYPRWWSAVIRFSLNTANRLWRWQRAMRCRRSINSANLPRLAGSRATVSG